MALIQADLLPGRGDQLLTFDSSSGLEWLNLTVTANRSYIDVLSGFGGFIGAFGFQYATPNQVGTLYKHAGVTKFGGPQAGLDLANHFGIEVLQDLMNGKSMAPWGKNSPLNSPATPKLPSPNSSRLPLPAKEPWVNFVIP